MKRSCRTGASSRHGMMRTKKNATATRVVLRLPPPPPLQSQILMHAIPDRLQRPNLSSVARHGFTIEVGPVPQGVLRHDAVQHTLAALYHVLDFIEHYNNNHNSR